MTSTLWRIHVLLSSVYAFVYLFFSLQSPTDPLLPNDGRGGTTNTQYRSTKVKECESKKCKGCWLWSHVQPPKILLWWRWRFVCGGGPSRNVLIRHCHTSGPRLWECRSLCCMSTSIFSLRWAALLNYSATFTATLFHINTYKEAQILFLDMASDRGTY